MAGYDFSFQVPERLRKEASNWLRFVQRLSKTRELDLMYRSAKSLPPTAEFYVRIDGPLPEMQRLQRQLPEFALPYVLSRNGKTNDAVKTISRFIAANQGGVGRITNVVFRIARDLSSTPHNSRASQLSLSPTYLRRAELTRSSKPEDRALKIVIRVIDLWSSRLMANEQAVITCDQAIESWMKARLKLPNNDRSSFPAVIERCLGSAMFSKKDASRLLTYHRCRNRLQHRSGKVKRETVQRMLALIVYLINEQ